MSELGIHNIKWRGLRRSQDQIYPKKKSLFQQSDSEELFQSKPGNLVKWTKLISANFSFKFSAFYYTSEAFPCTFLFRKEPFQYLGDL